MTFENPDDGVLREFLTAARRIAVADEAAEDGLTVVMDRCMKIEHSRLLGSAGPRG